MASYRINSFPAKPTFLTDRESRDASYYTANKIASTTFCNSRNCPPNNNIKALNYEKLYLLRNAKFIKKNNCRASFNTGDLNVNLFTKLDLKNVCVVKNNTTNQCPTTLNQNSTFYENYTIDPDGVLFGNSQCGVNNFENYIVPKLPCFYNTQNTR
jgi:hypothetical protein